MTSLPAPILRLANIHRSYNVGTEVETEVLHGIKLVLRHTEFVALTGPSGSGKSKLLNIIGRHFKNATERLEKWFEVCTRMTAAHKAKARQKATKGKKA